MTSLRNLRAGTTRGRLAMLALLTAAMLLAAPGESLAKKKKGGISAQKLKAQAAAATRRAAAAAKKQAQVAKQKAAYLRRQAAASRADLSRAEGKIRPIDPLAVTEARRYLENIVESLLGAQEKDSPFGQAHRAFKEDSETYRLARERAYETPEYKAAYQRALAGENRAAAVTKLRRETLESNRGVQQARLAAKVAETEYNRQRSRLLQASQDWQAAVDALRKLKQEHKEISERNAGARRQRSSAKSDLSQAEKGAARQQGLARRSEAAAKKFDAASRKLSKGSRNNRNRRRKRK